MPRKNWNRRWVYALLGFLVPPPPRIGYGERISSEIYLIVDNSPSHKCVMEWSLLNPTGLG